MTSRFAVGEQEFVVIAYEPLPSAVAKRLTQAERDVVCGVLEGWSDAKIAKKRKTRVRTVQNQLAAVYRKLGVASRGELMASLLGTWKES